MYEHLLVGLDGSPAAEGVLEHAEALAGAFHSTITLVRATISPELLIAETANTGSTPGEALGLIDPTPIVEADHATSLPSEIAREPTGRPVSRWASTTCRRICSCLSVSTPMNSRSAVPGLFRGWCGGGGPPPPAGESRGGWGCPP